MTTVPRCECCGFKPGGGELKGSLCFECISVEDTEVGGTLIFLPELSQGELAHLFRTAHVIQSLMFCSSVPTEVEREPIRQMRRGADRILAFLKGRAFPLKQVEGSGVDPRCIEGVRVLPPVPKKDRVAAWLEGEGTFSGYAIERVAAAMGGE